VTRRLDDVPFDPQVTASLDAIDATLAGEPVDPRHAELAELALLLAAERPEPDAGFAASLDQAVERRFAPAVAGSSRSKPGRRWWLWTPAAGLVAAVTVAIVLVVSGGPIASRSSSSAARPPLIGAAGPTRSSSSAARPPLTGAAGPTTTPGSTHAPGRSTPATSLSTSSAAAAVGQAPVLQSPANGRKVVQSAQLELSTPPSRIETVAQEVFSVVGQNDGIVKSSTVTATGGPGGYALFLLSIPSASLPETMASLSTLRYAHVASRTDTTQDVNDQYQADLRRLADARALRTSLLKQLANATTQAQIQSLTAQIHDAEASISSDEAALRTLNSQIDYSQVTLTINGGLVPVPVYSGGGFSLGQAAHDAGRVLTVAAGVALIVGAVLIPLSLLAALGWWIGTTVRRRRREQVLDLV
jgi:Domain of unknown function (DUF4349)